MSDTYTCPLGGVLRHTTTDRDGKRTYRTTPKNCVNCPHKKLCGANSKGQKILTRHIWQEHLDLVEQLRKTERGKEIYAMRKETIERVFGDAKEKHAMRYTQHRGLARGVQWWKVHHPQYKIYQQQRQGQPALLKWGPRRTVRLCGGRRRNGARGFQAYHARKSRAQFVPTRPEVTPMPTDRTEARELTRSERVAIRKLVTGMCANFGPDHGCLPLDCPCYMLSKWWTGAYCKYFQNAVLPLDSALTGSGAAQKICPVCGAAYVPVTSQAYCSEACSFLPILPFLVVLGNF